LLCLLSYATIAHTPGLRIRFVRFRQTVWAVVVIVTSPGSISVSRPLRQIARDPKLTSWHAEAGARRRTNREPRRFDVAAQLRQNSGP
jgi:hypothetical protein